MPQSIARLNTSMPSFHGRSSADFTTDIAESSFRYTHHKDSTPPPPENPTALLPRNQVKIAVNLAPFRSNIPWGDVRNWGLCEELSGLRWLRGWACGRILPIDSILAWFVLSAKWLECGQLSSAIPISARGTHVAVSQGKDPCRYAYSYADILRDS
jgi:hypothetical protein